MSETCSILDTVAGQRFGPDEEYLVTGRQKVQAALAAFLGANSRRGKTFLDTGIKQVPGGATQRRLPDSDGGWLERLAGFYTE